MLPLSYMQKEDTVFWCSLGLGQVICYAGFENQLALDVMGRYGLFSETCSLVHKFYVFTAEQMYSSWEIGTYANGTMMGM